MGVVGDDLEVKVTLHAPLRVEVEAHVSRAVVDEKRGSRQRFETFGEGAPDTSPDVVAHHAVESLVAVDRLSRKDRWGASIEIRTEIDRRIQGTKIIPNGFALGVYDVFPFGRFVRRALESE